MSIEHRKDFRQDSQEKIIIEILSASSGQSDDSVLLECNTRDISSTGLKIQSDYPLIVGSILELLIKFAQNEKKYLLTGEVKWFETLQDGSYLAGFELIEAEHSDYLAWQAQFVNS